MLVFLQRILWVLAPVCAIWAIGAAFVFLTSSPQIFQSHSWQGLLWLTHWWWALLPLAAFLMRETGADGWALPIALISFLCGGLSDCLVFALTWNLFFLWPLLAFVTILLFIHKERVKSFELFKQTE